MILEGAFDDKDTCKVFRKDLKKLLSVLNIYTQMLADMAGVEDLTKVRKLR